LLIEALQGRELRPSSSRDFDTVANLVLVCVTVQTVAVDVLSVGIDRRRRGRVARAAGVVDLARARTVLMAPDDRSGLRIEGDDLAVARGDEQQILDAERSAHTFEKYRRTIRRRRQR